MYFAPGSEPSDPRGYPDKVHGQFGVGDTASGRLLPRLRVNVTELKKFGEKEQP